MTFYHHVEEINNVDYRYFKKFSGNYIDKKFKNAFGVIFDDIIAGIYTVAILIIFIVLKSKLY